MSEQINTFVDVWTVAWTLVVAAGYLAELTPFPRLSILRSTPVLHGLLVSSAAVVLGLTVLERPRAAALVTAWAIIAASIKLLWDAWETDED